jgi:hypothetical protein
MAERRRDATDLELEHALRALGAELVYPAADIAAGIRTRLETAPPPRGGVAWPWTAAAGRRLRWSLVLAVAALLVVVAVVAAGLLGVPGIRLVFGPAAGPGAPGPASASPASPASPVSPAASASVPSSGAPGAHLGLGREVALGDLPAEAGFTPRLPNDPAVPGPPGAVFVLDRRVSLVWAPGTSLPATIDPEVGMVLMEFLGKVDDGYLEKLIDTGTRVETVTVAGSPGYWISEAPHWLFYVDDRGVFRQDLRRIVGDVLIWSEGPLTYRLETSLGRDAALRIAESIGEE